MQAALNMALPCKSTENLKFIIVSKSVVANTILVMANTDICNTWITANLDLTKEI